MTHHENLKIIAFVGLAGSGKSTAVEYFTAKSYPKVSFDAVMRQTMEADGIEITPANEQKYHEDIREKNGQDFIANKIADQITHLSDAGQHRVVIDGIQTWTEYKLLRHAFPGELTVVALVAPRHVRYHRLTEREQYPLTATQAHDRDIAEIERLEKGGPIAIADHYISSEGSVEELQKNLAKLAEELRF